MANSAAVEAEIRRLYREEDLGLSKIVIRIKQAFPGGPSYDPKRIRAILAADKSIVAGASRDEAPPNPVSVKPRAKGKRPVKADPPLSRAEAEEGIATLIMSRQRRKSITFAVGSMLMRMRCSRWQGADGQLHAILKKPS